MLNNGVGLWNLVRYYNSNSSGETIWKLISIGIPVTTTPDQKDVDKSLIELSLTPLRPQIPTLLKILHTSSNLFTSEYFQLHTSSSSSNYDAIDWSVLQGRGGNYDDADADDGESGGKNIMTVVVCDRCGWRTEALTKSASASASGVKTDEMALSPWAEWKKQSEENCMCGGTWVRKHVEVED